MIRSGEEIRVIDNDTNEDLTTLTLTQLIYDQQKKRKGFLPHSILAGMLRSGEERWTVLQRSIVSSRFFSNLIDDSISHRIQMIVDRGEFSEDEGRTINEKLLQVNELNDDLLIKEIALPEFDNQTIDDFISTRSIPTQDELGRLTEQLDALENKIEELSSTTNFKSKGS